jgi:Transposase domain (DUF772)/Phage integrase family
MRGDDQQQSGMFSYVSLEERVPQDHPLRWIRKSMDEVLRAMAKDFDGMYAKTGRPSVPPERLLRAALLQIFYTVRIERMLMERMNYNLLFRWFELELDEPVWKGTPLSERNLLRRLLKPAAKRLGIPWLSWHVFRHTHATLGEQIGMALSDRQAQMGHGDVRMTMHYTHSDLTRRRQAIEAMSDRLIGVPATVN